MSVEKDEKYWEKLVAYFSREWSKKDEEQFIQKTDEKEDGKQWIRNLERNRIAMKKNEEDRELEVNLAWEKLRNRISTEKQSPKLRALNRPRFVGIAASILVLLGIGFALLKWSQRHTRWEELKTTSQQSKVILADGTAVYLNANSALEFPTVFKGENRIVKLKGEAFFDVKHNKNHPFIIETQAIKIKVLGTSFNVKSSREEAEVLVSRGSVQLQNKAKTNEFVVLKKGEFASLKNHQLKSRNLDDVNYLAWHTKMLIFDHTPLNQVVNTLNRVYSKHIVLQDEKLYSLPLTAKYNQMEVNVLLKAICISFDLKQKHEKNTIVLYSEKP
jgi:ferric-dicitrate binding protein FerR (iron transport regulator)